MRDSKQIIIVGNLQMKYERAARIYSGGGISPTISARDYKDAIKIITNERNQTNNVRQCQ